MGGYIYIYVRWLETRHLIAHITHSGDDMLAQCISTFDISTKKEKHAAQK
jgi:hypothetical protein